jgi:hypothetical protein
VGHGGFPVFPAALLHSLPFLPVARAAREHGDRTYSTSLCSARFVDRCTRVVFPAAVLHSCCIRFPCCLLHSCRSLSPLRGPEFEQIFLKPGPQTITYMIIYSDYIYRSAWPLRLFETGPPAVKYILCRAQHGYPHIGIFRCLRDRTASAASEASACVKSSLLCAAGRVAVDGSDGTWNHRDYPRQGR